MAKISEVADLRSMFKQLKNDRGETLYLLSLLKASALKNLPDDLKADWALEEDVTGTNARNLYLASRSQNELSPSQISAINLLYSCTRELPNSGFNEAHINFILDSYAGLEIDTIISSKKVKDGQVNSTLARVENASKRNEQLQEMADKLFQENPSMFKTSAAARIARKWNSNNPSKQITEDRIRKIIIKR